MGQSHQTGSDQTEPDQTRLDKTGPESTRPVVILDRVILSLLLSGLDMFSFIQADPQVCTFFFPGITISLSGNALLSVILADYVFNNNF